MRPMMGDTMRTILLLVGLLALPARAEIADFGSFTYELYQQMQENHTRHPAPPLMPGREPAFRCRSDGKAMTCQDDRHRSYQCTDHGAAGQYCQRQDGNAWIHCFRQLLGRYKCAVISSQTP